MVLMSLFTKKYNYYEHVKEATVDTCAIKKRDFPVFQLNPLN